MIMAETHGARRGAREAAAVFQRDDFLGILEAMAGYPGDDPAARPAAARILALARDRSSSRRPSCAHQGRADPRYIAQDEDARARAQLHEQNPMLGLRMCRLGIVYPEIYAMQVRAIFEAACELRARASTRGPT
jgi:pyruvate,orthophosphate dikinase